MIETERLTRELIAAILYDGPSPLPKTWLREHAAYLRDVLDGQVVRTPADEAAVAVLERAEQDAFARQAEAELRAEVARQPGNDDDPATVLAAVAQLRATIGEGAQQI